MVMTLDEKVGLGGMMRQAENAQLTDVAETTVKGIGSGVGTVVGPVALAGGAAFAAYVVGNLIGDNVPNMINYFVGQALPNNQIPVAHLSVMIPRGYGLVDAVAGLTGRDPSTISSGTIAATPVAAAFVGYLGSKIAGPLGEAWRGYRG